MASNPDLSASSRNVQVSRLKIVVRPSHRATLTLICVFLVKMLYFSGISTSFSVVRVASCGQSGKVVLVRITCRKTSLLNSKSKSMLIADLMPSTLNPDIFYSLATEIGSFRSSENLNSLLSLSLTCRVFRDACLPVVFADVHWPHRGKHDEQSGLHFFPTNLWPYFR